MKLYIKMISLLVFVFMLNSCEKDEYKIPVLSFEDPNPPPHSQVQLVQENGVWTLKVNGEDFYVKGAATNNFYEQTIKYGGNTVRTYGVSAKTKSILDSAYSAGLFVNFGLFVKRERDGFDYNNAAAVQAQLDEMRAVVNRFKDHPALLLWSVGNEAESNYTNTKLWDAINDIAEMIHEEDGNHPTTTALASSNVDHIRHIIDKAPGIDIISVNSYAPNLPGVLGNLQTAGWNGPYMITEFGPRGTWQMAPEPQRILPWGALVEQTSTEKETDYLNAYQNNIAPNRNNGCLGSFVFLWGYQTHGEVLNWYGMFDKKGYTYPAVDAMQFAWTGSYPANRAPVIASRADMLLNNKRAEEAVELDRNSAGHSATVVATDPDNDPLTYEWIIIQESTASSDGSLPDGITGLITDATKAQIAFRAPSSTGNYRLYVFVRDDANKKVASAVIPFRVI